MRAEFALTEVDYYCGYFDILAENAKELIEELEKHGFTVEET